MSPDRELQRLGLCKIEDPLLKLLAKVDRRLTRILDVGSGWGRTTYYSRALWPHAFIVSLDISREGARFVKLRSRGEYVIADGRKLPFKSNSFDLVTCTQVIEHLRREEQLSFTAELKRVLRKGGYIYDVSNV